MKTELTHDLDNVIKAADMNHQVALISQQFDQDIRPILKQPDRFLKYLFQDPATYNKFLHGGLNQPIDSYMLAPYLCSWINDDLTARFKVDQFHLHLMAIPSDSRIFLAINGTKQL